MTTIAKRWLACGLICMGCIGCQNANESSVMTRDDGTKQEGVTPPTAIKDSSKFAKQNPGAITSNSKNKGDYKGETGAK